MDLVALLAIQVLYAIASLALISVGLAIIFGMMRVINLAHGEFLMLGGYAAIVATSHGISIWIAMLVVAPVVVGIIGVDRRADHHPFPLRPHDRHDARDLGAQPLPGRPDHRDLRQHHGRHRRRRSAASRSAPTAPAPIRCSSSPSPSSCCSAIFAVLRWTRLRPDRPRHHAERRTWPRRSASIRRASTPSPSASARRCRVWPARVLAPVSGVFPTIGVAYVAKSFITVIGGGAAIVSRNGFRIGAVRHRSIRSPPLPRRRCSAKWRLLAAAIVLIRLLPQGITGRFFRRSL